MIDLENLYRGTHLTAQQTRDIFAQMFEGKVDPLVCSSLLTALKMNGYNADEIGGAAAAMLQAAAPCPHDEALDVGEIVGTGGDCMKTINVSTLAGIICATLGLHIAKHGNTAVSSKTGASDMLQILGYDLHAGLEQIQNCLKQEGFAFLFAQVYHPGMRFIAPIRKTLHTSTIFNILGPLANPTHVDYEVLGCYDESILQLMAKALKLTGVQRALVVNGSGMDEISVCGHTDYAELFEDGHIETGVLTHHNFGLKKDYPLEAVQGGEPEENARIARLVLEGKGTDAQNAIVAANAAGLLRLSGKERDFKVGFGIAMDAIKSGKGADKLDAVIRLSKGQ